MRRILLLLILVTAVCSASSGQVTVRGRVTDKATGEPLEGVNIVIPRTRNGAITDAAGHYALSLTPGTHTNQASYLGYGLALINI